MPPPRVTMVGKLPAGLNSEVGYVWSYALVCPEKPAAQSLRPGPYLEFKLSSKADALADERSFFLERNMKGEEVDKAPMADVPKEDAYLALPYSYWAVAYGSLSMAIIAAVKDAFHSRKKVRVCFGAFEDRPVGGGPLDVPKPFADGLKRQGLKPIQWARVRMIEVTEE